MRCRARDLGLTVGRHRVGKWNAITDVAGIKVGHTTLIEGSGKIRRGHGPVRTGVTAILPNDGNVFFERLHAGGFVLNGAGEVSGARGHHSAEGTLAAPMPGLITMVTAKPGDAVEAGATLMVMEAMKMEHAIKAPADGVVTEIFFAEGDQVSEGAELIAIEVNEEEAG